MDKQIIEIGLVKESILDSATEDMTGLYEIIWELNTKFPDVLKKEKINAAQVAMQNLLDGGHLRLYKKFWAMDGEETVDENQWRTIIAEDKHWEPPGDDGLYYCFFETVSTNDELWKQHERNKNASQQ